MIEYDDEPLASRQVTQALETSIERLKEASTKAPRPNARFQAEPESSDEDTDMDDSP